MWADKETGRDFLNFNVMASLVSQMIIDANGQALSIGISGGWGVGKSSMVKLVEADLKAKIAKKAESDDHNEEEPNELLFVNFNAWLYQGHDDAKAALMEEIANALMVVAEKRKTSVEKGVSLLKRIDKFRLLKLIGEVGISAYFGLPVGALARAAKGVYDSFTDGEVTASDAEQAASVVGQQGKSAKDLIAPEREQTPPQMIHAIRNEFEALLNDLKVTLVVFVDDLDRCLPPTVIGTLEAMRLFLFMDRTAFIIAADDKMIKEAVRVHFPNTKVDDDIVISYFDKLIQVPLRVPPLGTQEVKAYLMMLFVDQSSIGKDVAERKELKENVRVAVNKRLAMSWKGESVDAEFVQGLIDNCPVSLKAELELADRLARQMIISPKVNGNPRLIKRFMNTLSIRRSLAKVQEIAVNDAMFAKLMLFERFASAASFNSLTELISAAPDGKSTVLRDLENDVRKGDVIDDKRWPSGWKEDTKLIEEWLKLSPDLGGQDLRGALHVGRESAPIIAAESKLSKNAATLLTELLALKVAAGAAVKTQFGTVAPDERGLIMTNLLDKASAEAEWGTPPILYGLAAIAEADKVQADRLIVFFGNVSSSAIKTGLIPRLGTTEWGKAVLIGLGKRKDLSDPVSRAVGAALKEGK
ncbi:KAP family P-loop domain protein [Neorhizobium galegae]|uniref:KAP family NTPase n=1 Tax=Neorhizobium galegae TaxID=399 RepID=UPI0021082E2A|nr:KAP family P-loop domain protein [Neorhizobium galegae]MCQ1779415.1 KAP family P-loop domain protein [Neorhizobium galegae]MCQ1795575.1 KAP family P-loop domain protein [Neorhizobium galegae]